MGCYFRENAHLRELSTVDWLAHAVEHAVGGDEIIPAGDTVEEFELADNGGAGVGEISGAGGKQPCSMGNVASGGASRRPDHHGVAEERGCGHVVFDNEYLTK